MKILYLGNKLSKHGINKTTVETLGEKLSQSGFNVVSYSSKKNSILRILDMLFGILKHKDAKYILIDTYSTSAFWFAFFGSQLARMLHIKYIPILHGGNLPNRLISNPKLCKMLFNKAFVNVSPSEYLKYHFEKFGISNVVCIPNSINVSEYSFKERQSFAPNLIWVRAFAEIYNPKMAIDVLNILQKKYPSATLTMVGPDKDGSLDITKKYANQFNLNVNFTGKLSKEEWTDLAQNHDIFINTTHFDNTPVSVLEAMALGLPVISTNVGGLPFLISHQKNGYLVNDNDASEMVEQIEQIINFPSQTNEIIGNAKSMISKMDWKVVDNQWTNLLR
ncbi:glycosyltransferase family 4 protein [Flavobacterium terrigena]|uniref:Glycosyltransferase involved in cell wall bisynthesis n=1 Tax=Flavobacterium terrigena TaxID=402734 RepID=A0A1H6R8B4_9FLAO|nr:glycosyltransferase family 4 protein [Flavobacterium terrigena]SEI48020.1 Glycosyltransferase involved in cell wall bisynthesis [Flavobacterium terrigena]